MPIPKLTSDIIQKNDATSYSAPKVMTVGKAAMLDKQVVANRKARIADSILAQKDNIQGES